MNLKDNNITKTNNNIYKDKKNIIIKNNNLIKIIKNKTKIINKTNIFLIYFLIIIFIPKYKSNKIILTLRKLNLISEISISINGSDTQKILGDSFKWMPTEIKVNEKSEDKIDKIIYNLPNKINKIIIKWDYQIEDCFRMFSDLNNITEIDLSKFDSSKVTSMEKMFNGCKSLTSLNLKNLNTSSVKKMRDMFFGCALLNSLNLSNFDTSSVTDMGGMFYSCNKIVSLFLDNFNTKSVKLMDGMFFGCNNLMYLDIHNFETSFVINMKDMFNSCNVITSINVNSFNTSSVVNMQGMFYFCKRLISLDLNSFDTSSVINMEGMFYGCNKLAFLYLNNFNTSLVQDMSNMFRECTSLSLLNLSNFNTLNVEKMENMFINTYKFLLVCVNELKNPKIIPQIESINRGKIITDKNLCVNSCTQDNIFIYEYNFECYKQCPKGSYSSSENNKICEKNITDKIIIETDKTIVETDKINKVIETDKIIKETDIKEKSDINEINDSDILKTKTEDLDKIEKNEEYLKICKESKYYENACRLISYNNTLNNNLNTLSNIKKELLNGSMDNIISYIIIENKKDIIIKEDNIIYQITSFNNQNNNKYNNISTINLGDCETKLRYYHNISDDIILLILKIDFFEEGLKIPIIEYEVYNSINKQKLNLSICKDTKVKISIPVSINEDKLFLYNSSSEFYNDICFPYTTEKGTDIILEDRKNEFIKNNMSLCEKNCKYNGYVSKKALCECEVKIELPFFSDLVINKDKLLNKFIDIKNEINISIIKCIDLLFSKKGLKNNIGNYIILIIIFINIILMIIFKQKGYKLLYNELQKIINNKKNKNIKNIKNNNNELIVFKKSKFSKEKKNKEKNNKIIKKIKNAPKKRKEVNKSYSNIIQKNEDSSRISNVILKNLEPDKITKSLSHNNSIIYIKKRNKLKKNVYNDYELNVLKYNDAIKIDKRTYFQYYISLLKRRQLILFTFYTKDDYNSKIIKLSLFLFSFVLYYSNNALFFNDSTMHKIYEDEGSFNIIYQIPHILYSSIISISIQTIIIFFSLSEKEILKIKDIKGKKNIENELYRIKKCLIIKFIIFYLINFSFLFLFWFYLSSFCAVYKNTQIHLIKDTLISFLLSMLYPFGFCLLPGIFRIIALRAPKKDKKCLYNFSKIIQLL